MQMIETPTHVHLAVKGYIKSSAWDHTVNEGRHAPPAWSIRQIAQNEAPSEAAADQKGHTKRAPCLLVTSTFDEATEARWLRARVGVNP